jgi:hypothetical protein
VYIKVKLKKISAVQNVRRKVASFQPLCSSFSTFPFIRIPAMIDIAGVIED